MLFVLLSREKCIKWLIVAIFKKCYNGFSPTKKNSTPVKITHRQGSLIICICITQLRICWWRLQKNVTSLTGTTRRTSDYSFLFYHHTMVMVVVLNNSGTRGSLQCFRPLLLNNLHANPAAVVLASKQQHLPLSKTIAYAPSTEIVFRNKRMSGVSNDLVEKKL